ncbi:MAG: PEGA domain-containing protein [bacterium]|nr:PEGA domain-containing protein [bacterium]
MTPRIRLIVNILAWLVFLLVAPFLISYSMGHRFTPISPNSVSVGTFLIRTIPNSATITINDKKLSNKTPTSIQNLLPGNYNIKLEKDGYRSWVKNLPIIGTMITDARDVRLVPFNIEEDVMRSNVVNFNISPKRQLLGIFEQIKNGYQLRIVPINKYSDTGTIVKLSINKKESANILWSPNEDFIALTLTTGKSSRHYLIEISTGTATPLTDDESKLVGWIATLTEEKLIILKNKKAIITSLKSSGTETISQDAEAISFTANGFAILENNAEKYTIRTYSSSGNEQDQIETPTLSKNSISNLIYSPTGDIAILVQPTQSLIVWDNSERVWHNVTTHAESVSWSPEGDKIAWQESEFDLWVMNLHEKRSPLNHFSPELIARLSSAIRKPTWYAGSHQILFFEKDILKMADIDQRNGHIIYNLISTNRGDGTAEVIQNGDEIIATVARENKLVLSRFFMLEKADR